MNTVKKLYRSKSDRVILGVCGGLGDYFMIDPLLIRFIFVVLLFSGTGLIIYFIFVFLVPFKDDDSAELIIDSKKTDNISDWRFILGIIIIMIGVFKLALIFFPHFIILLKNLLRNFWPIILIILGGAILFKNNKKK